MAPPTPVIWAPAHNPPFSIIEGDAAGDGVSQRIIGLIAERTPDLVHVERPMPVARLIGMVKAGHTLCSTMLLNTADRESFLTFSAPILYILPNLLFTRPGEAARWTGPGGEVDLEAALAGGLRLAVIRGRHYGPVIDAALGRRPAALVAVNSVDAAIRMVAAGRVDATLLFGEQYAFLREVEPGLPLLTAVEVRGTALNPARISCTKGREGDRLVARMAAAVDADFRQDAIDIYTVWLPPDLVAMYRRRLAELTAADPD